MSLGPQASMLKLSEVQLAHTLRLKARIAEAIDGAGGWLSFEQYTRLALYEPGLGYYSAGATKFGEAGDFVTAPEISPFFARACAEFFDRWLRAMDGGDVLELGPGSGRFARDAMQAMLDLGTPFGCYRLLEVSADLRARQQDLLADLPLNIDWLERLPTNFSGIIFGNEVMDALPCDRFVIRGGDLLRLGVGLTGGNVDGGVSFEWRARVADGRCEGDDEFSRQAQRLHTVWNSSHLLTVGDSLPEGYCGEWQPSLAAWIGSLANSLSQGVIVLADYGLPRAQLYHPDRVVGTLRCHQRHHAHGDPFSCPGLVDITSWVDFSTVAEAAEAAGLTVSVFTTQMGFLLASGATMRPSDAKAAQALRQLLLPGEMGEAIKFMVLSREFDVTAQITHEVLARQDLRESLGV